MDKPTITHAVKALEELHTALINAYWEANQLSHKDNLFELIHLVTEELREHAKLSVEDLSLTYEPLTVGFRACTRKLKKLHSNTEDWFPRSTTSNQLEEAIPEVVKLISGSNS